MKRALVGIVEEVAGRTKGGGPRRGTDQWWNEIKFYGETI